MKKVTITTKTFKQIIKRPKQDQIHIFIALEALSAWPDCRNVKALTVGQYRLRIGDYRAFFTVESDEIIVTEVRRRNERTYH